MPSALPTGQNWGKLLLCPLRKLLKRRTVDHRLTLRVPQYLLVSSIYQAENVPANIVLQVGAQALFGKIIGLLFFVWPDVRENEPFHR